MYRLLSVPSTWRVGQCVTSRRLYRLVKSRQEHVGTRVPDLNHRWTGLHSQRSISSKSVEQNQRAIQSNSADKRRVRTNTLDAVLKSFARDNDPTATIAFLRAARKYDPKYVPAPDAAATVLRAVVAAAPPNIKADAAIAAMLRLESEFDVRFTSPLLTVVAAAARLDRNVKARSQRIMSIVRLIRRYRVLPEPELILECFESCVAGLDITAAIAFMDLARAAGMVAPAGISFSKASSPNNAEVLPHISAQNSHATLENVSLPSQRDGFESYTIPPAKKRLTELLFYNGIIKACVFSGKYDAAKVALREMSVRGIVGDKETISLLVALYADSNMEDAAYLELAEIRNRGEYPSSSAYAAMIRLAGNQGKASAAVMLFEEFEQVYLRGRAEALKGMLSTVSKLHTHAMQDPSACSLNAAKDDVVLSMFQALRTVGAADRAIELLDRLKTVYKFVPTAPVLLLLYETCWRAVPQRLDAIDNLLIELKKLKTE